MGRALRAAAEGSGGLRSAECGPSAVDHLKHGREGNGTERRSRDVVDLAENLAQRPAFAGSLPGRILAAGRAEILEQLNDVE